MVIVQTSRPATADRKTMTWDKAGGGGTGGREGEGEGEGEGEMKKMRRLSQQSMEGVAMDGLGVSNT